MDLEIVSLLDPALDRESDQYSEWIAGSRSASDAPLLPGKRPLVFAGERLTRQQWRIVHQQPSDYEKAEMAFRLSIRSASGGRLEEPWRPLEPGSATDAELDAFDVEETTDIGVVVLTASRLGKALRPRYPASHLSTPAWMAMESASRDAAGSQTPAAESSDEG